jgi:hypothetical protein
MQVIWTGPLACSPNSCGLSGLTHSMMLNSSQFTSPPLTESCRCVCMLFGPTSGLVPAESNNIYNFAGAALMYQLDASMGGFRAAVDQSPRR